MTVQADGAGGEPGSNHGSREAAVETARERQSHVRHELRAPLAVIYPLLSMLLDGGAGALSTDQRGFLEVLDRNVERLARLIAGVTESGWADCSAAPAMPSKVALGDVLEEVVAMRGVDDENGPPISVDAGSPPSLRAWADRDDVRQIVADLVRNAATYTPSTGNITVRVAPGEAPGTVVIEVADTGPGIPPEELPRAFDFGFRGEFARTLGAPGLGIGLWVCRELAARNGGSVSLVSEAGMGAIASLTLPATARA